MWRWSSSVGSFVQRISTIRRPEAWPTDSLPPSGLKPTDCDSLVRSHASSSSASRLTASWNWSAIRCKSSGRIMGGDCNGKPPRQTVGPHRSAEVSGTSFQGGPHMQRKILLLGVAVLAIAAAAFAGSASAAHKSPGVVFTLGNQPGGNAVLAYDRSAGGTLTPAGTYPTGGNGSGAGLGSQGSVVLAAHGHRLFAVNAASNSVTEFKVDGDRLKWVTTVPSGGSTPISLTYRHHVLYVLNAGGAGNIAGFRAHGESLTPIAGSTQPLGAGSSGPAQVSFTPDGNALVVTGKSSNTIDVYAVRNDVAGAPTVSASAGGTPFGFVFAGGPPPGPRATG